MKVCLKRVSAFAVALFVLLSSLVVPTYAAGISFDEGGVFGKVVSWIGGSAAFDALVGTDHSGNYVANKPQAYYTTPTESVEDKYGNVTNYYRGGDTTTTKIIDSYNHTFNTIHNTTNNTTNNTNNYSANVKLHDFLNSYTTNNNNYTYNTEYKSWYYDNTSNTYNFDASQTYYNTDNSQYYISIDNSTDEYYLVDVKYSPTFVTVNYTYNTTNNNYTNNYGDVTNVYYFELTDGRNSSTLSADEVAGLDLGYDVANYELVTDDPNTLSLQHFDGDYTDSSSYGRTFYSENRSSNYVDSSAFGQAVKLPSGSAAGVTLPGLSDYDGLTFDFRVYYDKIDSLGIYFGDSSLFQKLPQSAQRSYYEYFTDDGTTFVYGRFCNSCNLGRTCGYSNYTDLLASVSFPEYGVTDYGHVWLGVLKNSHTIPSASDVSSWNNISKLSSYGFFSGVWSTPTVYSVVEEKSSGGPTLDYNSVEYFYSGVTHSIYSVYTTLHHSKITTYQAFPSGISIPADFSYSTYANQWVSMRITIDDGKLYYFVNGDLVGSGDFTTPTAEKFYIKSSGTVYLDELRVTTGDMVSSEVYTPSSAPYDTNKVLALPTVLAASTIYARHSTPVSAWRVGGVRPSNPSTGFLYIPLYDDYTGGQAQLYDGANWVDVEAMVYDGTTSKSAKGYQFTPMGASSDVDTDLKEPDGSDEGDADGSCTHEWEEESAVKPTCYMAGSVTYKCSKCEGTKTEAIAKLSHAWEVKQSVQTTYDESGNILTEGFTIYRCTVCSEEYKDTTGSGPPSAAPDSGSDSDEDSGWFGDLMDSIGEFFGTTIGALLELIGSLIGQILDGLITLVTSTIERITQLVTLFGSFGEALGVLWGWLPEEIVVVLVAGVTILVLLAIVKMFLK